MACFYENFSSIKKKHKYEDKNGRDNVFCSHFYSSTKRVCKAATGAGVTCLI